MSSSSLALDEMLVAKPRSRGYAPRRPTSIWGLSDLPSHWREKPLKYLARINPDKLSDDTDPDFEMEYVDIGNVTLEAGIGSTEKHRFEVAPSRARRLVRDGDTIVSTVRTYLKAVAPIADPPDNLVVSTGFAVLRPGKDLIPGYLFRLAQSDVFVQRIMAHSVGVSYPAINASDIGRFAISLPPLEEQRAIAAFLDRETAKIDELIAKKQRLVSVLEQRRVAMVEHAVSRGINRTAEMKASGVSWPGTVPATWDVVPLRHIVESIQTGPFGSQLHQSDYLPGGIPLINPVHLIGGRIVPESNSAVDHATRDRLSRHRVVPGDILFARRGDIGRCALVAEHQSGWLCGTGCMRVRLSGGLPSYFNRVFNSRGFAECLTLNAVGTTMLNINNTILARMLVPCPSIAEQDQIDEFIQHETEELTALTETAQIGISRIREYRSALVSAAVTGQIDVRQYRGEAACP